MFVQQTQQRYSFGAKGSMRLNSLVNLLQGKGGQVQEGVRFIIETLCGLSMRRIFGDVWNLSLNVLLPEVDTAPKI